MLVQSYTSDCEMDGFFQQRSDGQNYEPVFVVSFSDLDDKQMARFFERTPSAG